MATTARSLGASTRKRSVPAMNTASFRLYRAAVVGVTALVSILAATGCTLPAKQLEIHYSQIGTCKRWSDNSDDPNTPVTGVGPLIVFRINSLKNVSVAGTPDAVFDV